MVKFFLVWEAAIFVFLSSVAIASSADQAVKEMLISPSGRLMREERRVDDKPDPKNEPEVTASGNGAQASVQGDASGDDDTDSQSETDQPIGASQQSSEEEQTESSGVGSDTNLEGSAPSVASQSRSDPDGRASDSESQLADRVETDDSLKDASVTSGRSETPSVDSEMDNDNGEKDLDVESQSGDPQTEVEDNIRLEASQQSAPKSNGQSPVEDQIPDKSSEQVSTDDEQTNDVEPTASEGQQDVMPEVSGEQASSDLPSVQEADSNGETMDISSKNADDDSAEGMSKSSPPGVESLFVADDAGSEGGLDSASSELRADEIVRHAVGPPANRDETNLIKNGDFQSGTSGWNAKCPEEQKNGHDITGRCTSSGVWTRVPATSKGADTKAYHLKDRCYEQTKGGVYQDFDTEYGYTYVVSYKVIDGWFRYKNGGNGAVESSSSYVEVESPLGFAIVDKEFISRSSAKEPVRGSYESVPTFEFVAGGIKSRIYFYGGPGSCANIDDVKVIKTKASRLDVYPLAAAITERKILATRGSFNDDFSTEQTSLTRVLDSAVQNRVDLYPSDVSNSEASEKDEPYNDLDVDVPTWTHGGCSKMAGSVKLVEGTVPITMNIQVPRGSDEVVVEVGTGGVVFSPDVDDSPEWIRFRTFSGSSRYDNSATLETKVFFYCQRPSREHWTLETFHFAGLDGLCLSVAASDAQNNDFGCHDLNCRGNSQSDATLQPCDATIWSQSFYLDDKGLMRSASMADRCLDVASLEDRDCLPLTLSLCDAARDSMQFSKTTTTGSSKDVKLMAYGKRFLTVMQAEDSKPAFDQWVQACRPRENANGDVDTFSVRPSKIEPQAGAEEGIRQAGRGSLPSQPLAENEPVISNVWAEAICPWFFNPPVNTGSDRMKCYDLTLCEEEGCCDERGGTFLCSADKPYMCAGAAVNGTRTYACKSTQEECEELGGRRKCEGPPGQTGPEGESGPAGTQGAPGADGVQGPEGAKGGTSNSTDESTSSSTGEALLQTVATKSQSWSEKPATVGDGIAALIINLLMCSLFYASLKAKVRSIGATSADTVNTAPRASVAASVAGQDAEVAGSAPPSAPPSLPAGSAPPSAPASEAGEAPP